MSGKIKSIFLDNWGLKIIALVFSCLLWLLVTNTTDPNTTKQFVVGVSVTNEETLISSGKYYDVLNNNNTVAVKVTGKRSIIEKLSSSDFVAIADLNNLEEDKRVPVDVTISRYSNQVEISSKQLYLNVVIEEQMTSNLMIDPVLEGKVAEGFVIDDIRVNPEYVVIKGRANVVSTIEKVTIPVDVSGRSGDFEVKGNLTFYNPDGEKVDISGLDISVERAAVQVDLSSVKAVGIQVMTSGEALEGIDIDVVGAMPDSIYIKGPSSVINSITNIVIPDDVINLSYITADFGTTVDITQYLPEGVELYDQSQATVGVYVQLARDASEDITISADDIEIVDLKDGLKYELDSSEYTIRVTAKKSLLDSMEQSLLKAKVEADGLEAGSHTVPLEIVLPEGYTASDVTVKLVLKDDTSASHNSNTTSEGSSTSGTTESSTTQTTTGQSEHTTGN